jgi:lincosamide nucleotidyltransferase
VLPQEAMIERVREICERDESLMAAMMYGSFALLQGDRFSDIEFYFFFRDERLDEIDEEEWVRQSAPVELYYANEFGNGTAIFDNLIRGEFHFEKAANVGLVDEWQVSWFPSLGSVVLVDRDGELSRHVSRLVRQPPDLDAPERARFLCNSLINWTLMGSNLLKRGEYARALTFLTLIHNHLLQAVRLVEGNTANWLSPSRRLEEDITAVSYARFKACTTVLDADGLVRAYRSAWEWSQELLEELATRHEFSFSITLLAKLDEHMGEV